MAVKWLVFPRMKKVHAKQKQISSCISLKLMFFLVRITKYQRAFAGCVLTCHDGSEETYNGCIVAAHAPDALKMLGDQATHEELRILGAFQYVYR